jgi:signal transduction histidine kinase
MNRNLQDILEIIQQEGQLSAEQRTAIIKSLKVADKELEIVSFKLDRTEKVKRTTAILLEETIQELELKRKAVEESNTALQQSIEELRSAQAQLIQSEKMASLGELTAGIAHEIQNPLNFVNNFSEVSRELLEEMRTALDRDDKDEAKEIAGDVIQNMEKILHHGKRADGIVKGMLQHSRSSSGQKELTDINALCDEYLRLAYHGWRAKDHSFNAKFETVFDESVGKINAVPQDLGRVILNLINNAFFAVNERAKTTQLPNLSAMEEEGVPYEPTVELRTTFTPLPGKETGGEVRISIRDNGTGIPPSLVEKIFQPFFTTKPTGQGTGLGLSLSYDIITKGHGGSLQVETTEGAGTLFTIILPFQA